ncbi:MAG: recombination regulator RecX [Oscillospiraceae bacterium]|nr:recombination regulator RecX [Oscillospiraceae bacterium]
MITVNATEIFLSENSVHIELSNGKKYKILLKDYENLPFECKNSSRLENIIIDTDKINLNETNKYFNDLDGDCVEFLAFLSKKYNIYRSAISKVALTDMPKRQLYQKLCFGVYKNIKNNNTEICKDTIKNLCSLVCDEFEAAGYINDGRYAEDKAKYLKEYKKYGNNKIREYLYLKGIESDIISEVLDDNFFNDVEIEFENMRNLLKKKYGENLERLDKSDRNNINKALSMLIRNGYKYQDAKKALDYDYTEDTEDYIDG